MRVKGRAFALLLAGLLLVTGCTSDPTPSTSPAADPLASPGLAAPDASTPSPSPSPAPPASPSPPRSPATGSVDVAGGTVAVPGGASITVPRGALKKPATATIAAQAPPAEPTDAWPADAVGAVWSIDLGGDELKKPITLTIPYDAAALPSDQEPGSILLAYRDDDTGRWIPVPSTVDPVAHTLTASVTHLSTWGPFTINWDYWIAFIGKVASANLTDLLGAVQTAATKCATSDGVFKVSNGATNDLLKGCIRKVVSGEATIGVTNMRAIWLAVRSPASGDDRVTGPGDTVTFKTGGAKLAQPVVASARMTEEAFWHQLVDLLVRLLPGSEEFSKAGSYSVLVGDLVVAQKALWGSSQAWDKYRAGDATGAAEEIFAVLTGETFLTTFVKAAIAAGQEYGWPELSKLTPKLLSRIFLGANLAVLIGTLVAWDIQFLFGPSYGEVRVTWLGPPPKPAGVTVSARGPGHSIDCYEGFCGYTPSGGPSPWRLTWKDVAGEEGYRVYSAAKAWYGSDDPDECVVIIDGPPRLIAKLPADTTSVSGTWTAEGKGTKASPYVTGSTYYVEAVNSAGASKRGASKTVWYIDTVGECVSP